MQQSGYFFVEVSAFRRRQLFQASQISQSNQSGARGFPLIGDDLHSINTVFQCRKVDVVPTVTSQQQTTIQRINVKGYSLGMIIAEIDIQHAVLHPELHVLRLFLTQIRNAGRQFQHVQ